MTINNKSHLLITLDSCRYDVFEAANAPNLKKIGPLHKATSPSFFTFPSHKAIFTGFTPAVQKGPKWLNPKNGKLYRITSSSVSPNPKDKHLLEGRNIIQGFNKKGLATIGTGAVRWFNPNVVTGKELTEHFKHYNYFGDYTQAKKQIPWVLNTANKVNVPTFCFINLGETHDPYRFEGSGHPEVAAYKRMSDKKKAREVVFEQQKKCVEFLDQQLAPLINTFLKVKGTVIVTADHGELFGEDGLWQHQDLHEMTTTVPLLMNVEGAPQ